MRVNVSYKLGIITGITILVAMIAAYLMISEQLSDVVSKTTKTELRRDLMLNKQFLEQQPKGWITSRESARWIAQTGTTLDIRVTLIALDGRVLCDSSIPQERLATVENHRMRPEVQGALAAGYGENQRFSHTVKEYLLYIATPVGSPQPEAILRFSKPLYDIALFEQSAQQQIALQLFIVLSAALSAGLLATIIITRPLRSLALSAKSTQRVNVAELTSLLPRQDEVGTLARTFKNMSDDIATMQRSAEWYHAVFASIQEAIIVTNAAGDITLINPAASSIFGIDGAMFTARPIKHLSDNKLRELFAQVHSTRGRLQKEEVALMTIQGERIMQISSMPLTQENLFEGMVFVFNDITKLRNLERVRREFVSNVSHELRTPLTVISGYTETLLDGAIDDPKHALPFLNIILQASEQLTALVNDVLDLSKIESSYVDYHFAPVDVKRVVQQSVALLQPAFEKKAIRLDINIVDGLPTVNADARYLDIVIRNLLDNAIKYVESSNGKIRISAFQSGDNVRLEIEDNGIGIAKHDLDRIFERFYRVDKARSRQNGGTGLGLSIVKHIILAHKGDVQVRSRLHQGSTFSVILRTAKQTL